MDSEACHEIVISMSDVIGRAQGNEPVTFLQQDNELN